MRVFRIMFFVGICLCLSSASVFAKTIPAPLYNEAELKKDFNAFLESIDALKVTRDYPMAVRKLLSYDPGKQMQAMETLSATGEIEVIPWLLPFLDTTKGNLHIWAGCYLEKLVSNYTLKRRDPKIGEYVIIEPLRKNDTDLQPLAWVVLNMFNKRDDGNTHAYAATMTRYLSLYEFDRELQGCLKSRHPAVSNKAKWAIKSLKRQKEYDQELSEKPDPRISPRTTSLRVSIRDGSRNEKIITRKNLIKIKKSILKKGLRETYCNKYGNSPAHHTKNFYFYLDPDTGQENIDCDPTKSDFNSMTIRNKNLIGHSNQYRTVEFLDEHTIHIIATWPSNDLTVTETRQFVTDAIKEILKDI
jgi:hypothetical protein